jgi:hypothetical protein
MDDYGNVLPSVPTATVFETDAAPQPTGLLDASGTPLYRTIDREPIGFRVRAVKA